MKELWKVVKNYPDYEVSDKGQVRSYKKGYLHLLKPGSNGNYPLVFLYNEKGRVVIYIHTLVLEAFVGFCPMYYEANHKDGHKANNYVSNLEWITSSQNKKHAYQMDLRRPTCNFKDITGENHPHTKLKNKDVWMIKKLLWYEYSRKNIAKKFKVSYDVIRDIDRWRNWTHIKFEPTDKDRTLYKKQFSL